MAAVEAVRKGRGVVMVGGHLSVPCPVCDVPVGVACRRRSPTDGAHGERIFLGYSEAWVAEGDLVNVRSGSGDVLAELRELRGGVVLIRKWVANGKRWGKDREVPLRDVRGPAAFDDPRRKAADEALRAEKAATTGARRR